MVESGRSCIKLNGPKKATSGRLAKADGLKGLNWTVLKFGTVLNLKGAVQTVITGMVT